MPIVHRSTSFIIRIWWEQDKTTERTVWVWRGWIQHVHSGQSTYVRNLSAFIAFIEQWTGHLDDPQW